MFILKREISAFYLNKLLILSLTALFSLTGCQSITQTTTAISKISQKQTGTKVYLQGKVMKQAPFLGSGAYQLQDSTGSVWIVTNNYLPPLGKDIFIEGEIQFQTISPQPSSTASAKSEKNEIYIVELKQIKKTNSSQVTSLQKS